MDDKEISIQELSELTELSRNTISQMYNGKSKGIQFETLDKLLDSLSLTVQELIVYNPEKEFEKIKIELSELTKAKTTFSQQYKTFLHPFIQNEVEDEELIIGQTALLICEQSFALKVSYDDFCFSFPLKVVFTGDGLIDKECIKNNLLNSKHYKKISFEDLISFNQSIMIVVDGFEKNIRNFNYNKYQKSIIKEKLSNEIIDKIPLEIESFINDYEIKFVPPYDIYIK